MEAAIIIIAGVGLFIALLVGLIKHLSRGKPYVGIADTVVPAMRELGSVHVSSEQQGKTTVTVHEVNVERGAHLFSLIVKGDTLHVGVELDAAPDEGTSPGGYRGSARPKAYPQLPVLLLRREDPIDRIAKAIRLNREAQTGNEAFDRKVYVESDAVDELVESIVRPVELQNAVVALLDQGAFAVQTLSDGPPLVATWKSSPQRPKPPSTPDELTKAMDAIGKIADSLPPFVETTPPTSVRGEIMAILTWVATALLLFPALLFSNLWPTIHSDGLRGSAQLGLGLAFVGVLGALLRVRGRPRALRYFSWTAPVLLLTGPMLAMSVLHPVNALFDDDELHRDVIVTGYYENKGSKGGVSYYLEVTPWAPFDETITLRVDSSEYLRGSFRGARVRLKTGPGALGYEWLREIEEIDLPPP